MIEHQNGSEGDGASDANQEHQVRFPCFSCELPCQNTPGQKAQKGGEDTKPQEQGNSGVIPIPNAHPIWVCSSHDLNTPGTMRPNIKDFILRAPRAITRSE